MVEIDPEKVEALAAQGLNMEQIALSLGIARSTLYKRGDEESDISDAIKRGRAKGLATITNALFTAAENGNITAQIFYLKNRDPEHWKDRAATDVNLSVRKRSVEDFTDDELMAIIARGADSPLEGNGTGHVSAAGAA